VKVPNLASLAFIRPFFARQLPGEMRIGTGRSAVELAFFSGLSPADRTSNQERLFLNFHYFIMRVYAAIRWSIATVSWFFCGEIFEQPGRRDRHFEIARSNEVRSECSHLRMLSGLPNQ
jgi:hypothetical protein